MDQEDFVETYGFSTDDLNQLLERKQYRQLREKVNDLNEADTAEYLEELLGRRDTIRQSELLRTAAPSQYARETERDIRNTLDIVFDLLSRCYDPNVFCYASIYVSEVLYELLRHLSRISGDCVLEHYSLTDEAFDSGAVVGDITLARARYILAARQLGESGRDLTALQYDDMEERYGPQRMQSFARLLSLVDHRIARQNLAENVAYNKMFRLEYPPLPAGSDALYSDSKEEGSL